MGRIFWRSVGSAWNGTWSVMALAEPLKPPRSEIVITSWVTWPVLHHLQMKALPLMLNQNNLNLKSWGNAPNWIWYPRHGIICAVLSDQWDLPEKQEQGLGRLPTKGWHQKSEQTQTSFSLPMLFLTDLSWDGLDVGLDGRLPNSWVFVARTVFGLDLWSL